MAKYYCVFRNSNTIDVPGRGELPSSCKAKGCAGEFAGKPSCRTFMMDMLPPEKPFGNEMHGIQRMVGKRPHSFIYLEPGNYPARAVAKK